MKCMTIISSSQIKKRVIENVTKMRLNDIQELVIGPLYIGNTKPMFLYYVFSFLTYSAFQASHEFDIQ